MDFGGGELGVGVSIPSMTTGLLKDEILQLHYSWTRKEQNINWVPILDPLSNKDICNHLTEAHSLFK